MSTYRWSVVLIALMLVSGCASSPGGQQACVYYPPPANPQAVVFCADGAGAHCRTTRVLQETVQCDRLPLQVEMVDWSHGFNRILSDHLDQDNIAYQGGRLAACVRSWRSQRPGCPVYLLGHSAGCAILLEAAKWLPADQVERMVLLAPSVSTCYDLRSALRVSRQGVDVFISSSDWVALGLATGVLGTTDRRWGAAAGRVGFRPGPANPVDGWLYTRLRHHPWNPSQEWTGHDGGHYGAYKPEFFRSYVMPLLRCRT